MIPNLVFIFHKMMLDRIKNGFIHQETYLNSTRADESGEAA